MSTFFDTWPPAPPSPGSSDSLTSLRVKRRSLVTHSSLSLPRYVPAHPGRSCPLLRPKPSLSLSLCVSASASLQENLRLFAERKKKNIFLTLGALSNFGVCGMNRLTRMLACRWGLYQVQLSLSSLWPRRRRQLHLNSAPRESALGTGAAH